MNEPVVIFKAAQIRLAEIWDYTCGHWGAEQADHYLRELSADIERISRRRRLWRKVRDPRLPQVYFVRSAHHFLFFKELNGGIAVISVLHGSMDMLRRLREDDGLPNG